MSIRHVLGLVALLVAAVAVGVVVQRDPGYVLIVVGPYTVETSLSLFVILSLAGFAVLARVLRAAIAAWRLPDRARRWSRERRARRARRQLYAGCLALREGRWADAERLLSRAAPDSEAPLLNYLEAARAAQLRGDLAARDHWLRLAHEHRAGHELALGLTQAELQIRQRQWEQALATLRRLREQSPHHPYILRLLLDAYRQLGDWEGIQSLLPEVRKRRLLPPEELDEIETGVLEARLDRADSDPGALARTWKALGRRRREDPRLVARFARAMLQHGSPDAAEKALRQALAQHWDRELVTLYGQTCGSDPGRQLNTVEGWLRDHPQDPDLLLAAARIARRHRLWGKARAWLEAALGLREDPETLRELATLLEQLGEPERATELYRRALGTEATALPPCPEPATPAG